MGLLYGDAKIPKLRRVDDAQEDLDCTGIRDWKSNTGERTIWKSILRKTKSKSGDCRTNYDDNYEHSLFCLLLFHVILFLIYSYNLNFISLLERDINRLVDYRCCHVVD